MTGRSLISGFAVRQSIEQLELLKAKLMQEYFG